MSKHDPDSSSGTPAQTGSGGLLGTTRRKFVAGSSATWASVSLAGCLGGEDDQGQEDETPTYVVTDEVVAGSEGIPEGAGDLVASGRGQRAFVPGMQAVFKIGIWDPETGDIVSDNTIEDATVSVDGGEDIELEFASTDREWSGTWDIPEDHEAGTVEYEVQVSNGAEFTEVGVAENTLEIIEFDPSVANYVVTIDTITHDDQAGGWVQGCLPQHNYTADQAVGFHVGIYDGSNGELVDDSVVDSAEIVFNNIDADPVALEFEDPDDGEPLWSATWRGIPEDYTGTIEFEVQVSNEDEEFYNVGIESGTIEVIEVQGDAGETNYIVTDELYAVDDKAPETGGGYVQSCLPQHNFTPDMAVGIEIGIWDADSGEMVGPNDIDDVAVEFSEGSPSEVSFDDGDGDLSWGPGFEDGDPVEWEEGEHAWDVTWYGIPEGYSGTIEYEIQVSADRDSTRVGVYQGSFQVIEDPGL